MGILFQFLQNEKNFGGGCVKGCFYTTELHIKNTKTYQKRIAETGYKADRA